MLSLLFKIWLKYEKTIITYLKFHQISINQSITYQNYIWTKHIIFKKDETQPKIPIVAPTKVATASAETTSAKTASTETATASIELATAPAEVAIALVEATIAPAHSAVAPVVVSEIKGSRKNYLTIFSQMMNLMPSIFPSSKRSHFRWHHLIANSCDSTIKSLTLLLLAKKQNPTNATIYLIKDFSLFARFPFNQF